jgi:hypothetical protein
MTEERLRDRKEGKKITDDELKEIETFFLEHFRKELADARQEHYFKEVESRQIRVAEKAQLMALALIGEIRNLNTQLKEQVANELQTSNFKGGKTILHDWQMKKDVDWNRKVRCERCGKEIELNNATVVSVHENGQLEGIAYFCDIDCVANFYEGG